MLHIPNDCSATRHLPFCGLGWSMSYDWQVLPQNCLQRCLTFSVINFWHFCSIISGMERILRPHPDYWMHAAMSIQKFDYSFCLSTWRWRPTERNWRRCCASTRYLLELLNIIPPVLDVSSCDHSNHLNIYFAWMSLVASCMCLCVCGWSSNARFQHVRLQYWSVHLQCEMCSRPAPKVFIYITKHVRL